MTNTRFRKRADVRLPAREDDRGKGLKQRSRYFLRRADSSLETSLSHNLALLSRRAPPPAGFHQGSPVKGKWEEGEWAARPEERRKRESVIDIKGEEEAKEEEDAAAQAVEADKLIDLLEKTMEDDGNAVGGGGGADSDEEEVEWTLFQQCVRIIVVFHRCSGNWTGRRRGAGRRKGPERRWT